MKRHTWMTLAIAALSASSTALADESSYVYTPRGTRVSAIRRTFELSTMEIKAINDYVRTRYPGATPETDPSRKYNCHSYAWHSQSASNNIWINSPGDDQYWNDGSYKLITTNDGSILPIPSAIPNGSKVSYDLADHSAIKVSSNYYRSKWGTYPRMYHKPNYSPYACEMCCFLVSYYR